MRGGGADRRADVRYGRCIIRINALSSVRQALALSYNANVLLVSDGLDGLSGALVVVLFHVPVHGAQLHLPSEVNVHRALLHCGIDELI